MDIKNLKVGNDYWYTGDHCLIIFREVKNGIYVFENYENMQYLLYEKEVKNMVKESGIKED